MIFWILLFIFLAIMAFISMSILVWGEIIHPWWKRKHE